MKNAIKLFVLTLDMSSLARRSFYYVAVLPFGLLDLIFIFMKELKIIVSPAR